MPLLQVVRTSVGSAAACCSDCGSGCGIRVCVMGPRVRVDVKTVFFFHLHKRGSSDSCLKPLLCHRSTLSRFPQHSVSSC